MKMSFKKKISKSKNLKQLYNLNNIKIIIKINNYNV